MLLWACEHNQRWQRLYQLRQHAGRHPTNKRQRYTGRALCKSKCVSFCFVLFVCCPLPNLTCLVLPRSNKGSLNRMWPTLDGWWAISTPFISWQTDKEQRSQQKIIHNNNSFIFEDVPADGNCFYHTLMKSMHIKQKFKTVKNLKENFIKEVTAHIMTALLYNMYWRYMGGIYIFGYKQ